MYLAYRFKQTKLKNFRELDIGFRCSLKHRFVSIFSYTIAILSSLKANLLGSSKI